MLAIYAFRLFCHLSLLSEIHSTSLLFATFWSGEAYTDLSGDAKIHCEAPDKDVGRCFSTPYQKSSSFPVKI
jgi:hypothetical protein